MFDKTKYERLKRENERLKRRNEKLEYDLLVFETKQESLDSLIEQNQDFSDKWKILIDEMERKKREQDELILTLKVELKKLKKGRW